MEIWSRVRAPTLLVRGDASWAGDWERDGRLNAFRTAELVTIPGAAIGCITISSRNFSRSCIGF